METIPLAVISGGTGYVGSAICVALEKKGWKVVTLGTRASSDDHSFACDVTDENQVSDVIKKIFEHYGDISACIHAAVTPTTSTPLLDLDTESFELSLKVSVRGAFLLAKAAVPHMRPGSAFIGITSKLIEPEAVLPPTGSYITAKYGMRGFLRTLASELVAKSIRVYAVAPGFLPGGLNDAVSPEMLDFLATRSGVGMARVEDVANLVQKICIEKDTYASGTSISLSPEKVNPL